ncbi:unnamed protein product [Rotaria sp. Silwood2]|nr:unnamed protein product [Rotaria sp. Silwood2]
MQSENTSNAIDETNEPQASESADNTKQEQTTLSSTTDIVPLNTSTEISSLKESMTQLKDTTSLGTLAEEKLPVSVKSNNCVMITDINNGSLRASQGFPSTSASVEASFSSENTEIYDHYSTPPNEIEDVSHVEPDPGHRQKYSKVPIDKSKLTDPNSTAKEQGAIYIIDRLDRDQQDKTSGRQRLKEDSEDSSNISSRLGLCLPDEMQQPVESDKKDPLLINISLAASTTLTSLPVFTNADTLERESSKVLQQQSSIEERTSSESVSLDSAETLDIGSSITTASSPSGTSVGIKSENKTTLRSYKSFQLSKLSKKNHSAATVLDLTHNDVILTEEKYFSLRS